MFLEVRRIQSPAGESVGNFVAAIGGDRPQGGGIGQRRQTPGGGIDPAGTGPLMAAARKGRPLNEPNSYIKAKPDMLIQRAFPGA
jgi:hypothetical protein